MEEMVRQRGKATLGTLLAGAIVLALGCGDDENDTTAGERPPVPIIITASISTEHVSVSPRRFGAGPITLIVSNQTGASQRVTLESDDSPGTRPGVRQQTAPINPRDTARLEADVQPGRYRVAVEGGGIDAATVSVGTRRPSAQNQVLLP
jgi:hypothetical protein